MKKLALFLLSQLLISGIVFSQVITISIPNSSTVWHIGNNETVAWTWSGSNTATTEIKLKKNGVQVGSTQNTTSSSGSNTFQFPVPTGIQTGSDYQISVSVPGVSNDLSDYFSIIAGGTITISSPNASSVWYIGENELVAWVWSGSYSASTDIKLKKNGVQVGTTQNTTSNPGSNTFQFLVPTGIQAGTDYQITISAGGTSSTSPYFTVTGGGIIVVTLPNSSSTWHIGQNETVEWTWSGSNSASTEIKLKKNGVQVGTTQNTTSSPGSNSFQFPVPTGIQTGSDYQISVSVPGVSNDLSEFFTIAAGGTITISLPNSSSVWHIGQYETVAWTWSGSYSASTEIKLKKNGVQVGSTQSTTSNPGSNTYQFLVPTGIQAGTDYQITVSAGGTSSTSPYFTVTGGGIVNISLPNSLSVWNMGQNETVAWTWSGSNPASTEIILKKNGVQVGGTQYTTSTNGSNTFLFSVPTGIQSGSDYQISVSVPGASNDLSDYFTVTGGGTIAISLPNSSSIWHIGEYETAAWTWSGTYPASTEIKLKKNGVQVGSTQSTTSNPGSNTYQFLVPTGIQTGTDYQITVSAGGSSATSSYFEIIGGEIVIMTVTPTSWNFGNVLVGQSVTKSFIITNDISSTEVLFIEPGVLIPPFGILNGMTTSLDPGESITFTLNFSPTAIGNFTQNWAISNNSTNQTDPMIIPLNGTGVPNIINMTVEPNNWNFGNILVGQSVTKSFIITNDISSTEVLFIEPGVLIPPFGILNGMTTYLDPGESITYTLNFSPIATGSFTQDWTISNNSTNQNNPMIIPLNGTGVNEIVNMSVMPTSWDFGTVPFGQTVTKSFLITNEISSTEALIIEPGVPIAPFEIFNGMTTSLDPGESATFTINFSPVNSGDFAQDWTISNNSTNQNHPMIIPLDGNCEPFIIVHTPQPGELVLINHPEDISWTGDGVSLVSIQYTNNDATWNTLPGTYPGTGNYIWNVPGINPSSQCRIKIIDEANPDIYGLSGLFTIGNGLLDLKAPTGGEVWAAGQIKNISWQSININQIIIEFSIDNGVTWNPINDGDNIKNASDGMCVWQIPNSPSSQCKIKITDITNPTNQSQCSTFTILGFNVSNITLNVTPDPANINSFVSAYAIVSGVGSGPVSYIWKNEMADGSDYRESTLHTVNLASGQAVVYSSSDPFIISTAKASTWKVKLCIISPNDYEVEESYSITSLPNLQINVSMTSNSLLDLLQMASFAITVTDGSGNPLDNADIAIFNNVYNSWNYAGPTGIDGKTTYNFIVPVSAYNGLYSITFKATKNNYQDSDIKTQQLWVYHNTSQTGIKVIGCIQNTHCNPNLNTIKGFTIVAYIPEYINNKKIGARQLKIVQSGSLYGYIDFNRMGNSNYFSATYDDYSSIPNDIASWQIIATDLYGNSNYFPSEYMYEESLALDYLHLNSAIVIKEGKNKYASADLINSNSIQICNNKSCYLGVVQKPFNWTVQDNSSGSMIFPDKPVKIFASKSFPYSFLPPLVPKAEFLGYSSLNPNDEQLIIFNRYGISGDISPICFSFIDLILKLTPAKDLFDSKLALPIFYTYLNNTFTDILQSKPPLNQDNFLPILVDLLRAFIEQLSEDRELLLYTLFTHGIINNVDYDIVSFIIRDLLPVTAAISKGLTLADMGFTIYDLRWPPPPVTLNGIQLQNDNDTISILKTNGHFIEVQPINLAGVTSSGVIKGSTHSFSFNITNVSQQKLYNLWIGLDILAWDYTNQKYIKIENTKTHYKDTETNEYGNIDFSFYQAFDLESETNIDISSLNYTFDQSVTGYPYHEATKPYYYVFTVWSNGEPGQSEPVRAEMLTTSLIYKPFYIKSELPPSPVQLSKVTQSETDSAVFVYWNKPLETDIYQYHVLSDGAEIDVVDNYNQRTIFKKLTPQNICVIGENLSGITTTSNTIQIDPFPEYPSVYLSNPKDEAFINSLSPAFTWYQSPNAILPVSYDFELSHDLLFESIIYSSDNVQPEFILPGNILIYNDRYYWRVRANYPEGHESDFWSITYTFTTISYSSPNAPFDLTLVCGSRSPITVPVLNVNLTWTDTNSVITGFKVYRSQDTVNWATVLILPPDSINFTDTTVTEATRYYYKVAAFNFAGTSPLSDYVTDSISLGFPKPPNPLYPTDNFVLACDFSPIFKWKSEQSQFLFQVAYDSVFMESSIIYSDSNIIIKSDTIPASLLTDNTKYFWRVKAKNLTGWSEFSTISSFYTCIRKYNISGHFNYNNNQNSALRNVLIFLAQNGDTLFTTTTDSNGFYSFQSIPDGNYNIYALISIIPGGFNNTDAVKIRRHFSNIEPITSPIRLLAADVNNSGGVNNTDAVKIRRRFANLESTFARGDWICVKPDGGSEIIVNGSDVLQDLYGICVGDVNGSYVPGY